MKLVYACFPLITENLERVAALSGWGYTAVLILTAAYSVWLYMVSACAVAACAV